MDASGKAVILFGHGSRDPLWRQSMESVAARLESAEAGLPVRCAYLELDTPDLATAAGELIAGGARNLTVLPMFLGSGRHVREDLPALIDGLRGQFPAATFRLLAPVGEDPRVLDLIAKLALE